MRLSGVEISEEEILGRTYGPGSRIWLPYFVIGHIRDTYGIRAAHNWSTAKDIDEYSISDELIDAYESLFSVCDVIANVNACDRISIHGREALIEKVHAVRQIKARGGR